MLELQPFQRRFIRKALSPDVDTAAMSLPRGNGKSALAGHILTRVLTPTDPLWRPGTESVLCAGSLDQARIVFRFARADLEPTGEYRFLDSADPHRDHAQGHQYEAPRDRIQRQDGDGDCELPLGNLR